MCISDHIKSQKTLISRGISLHLNRMSKHLNVYESPSLLFRVISLYFVCASDAICISRTISSSFRLICEFSIFHYGVSSLSLNWEPLKVNENGQKDNKISPVIIDMSSISICFFFVRDNYFYFARVKTSFWLKIAAIMQMEIEVFHTHTHLHQKMFTNLFFFCC